MTSLMLNGPLLFSPLIELPLCIMPPHTNTHSQKDSVIDSNTNNRHWFVQTGDAWLSSP